ncbi:MAG TPA: sodium:proton antiporter [Acetobacteraceae bacterium]|nr:sodium:proton antiporter [Acetobacteraceae bacterium]
MSTWAWAGVIAMVLLPVSAAAEEGGAKPGAPSLAWGIPFAALLLAIAFGPMLAPRLWHRHVRWVISGCILALLVPQTLIFGPGAAADALARAVFEDYLPFITLLLALYTTAGGVLVVGGPWWGTPAGNTALLALGTLLGGIVGTTAAAMVLIHPLLAANAHRSRKGHLVVFFVVLVANAGGVLSPIGNPPLYVGFLEGVPFFWPLRTLWLALLLLAGPLLAGFYLLDRRLAAGEGPAPVREPRPLRLRGVPNLVLILVVALAVVVFGTWPDGSLAFFGGRLSLGRVLSVLVSLAATLVSVLITPRAVRQRNMFSWAPILEVAWLFAAIFITIGPVLAMLHAGLAGPLGGLLRMVESPAGAPIPAAYFWLTGVLSAFLDNAPTYLVFFGMAGGDAGTLTGSLSRTLVAISTGAVFFGGLTYIGAAPNLLIRAIAARRGVRMPGFFGYCGAALLVLALPLLLVTLVLF